MLLNNHKKGQTDINQAKSQSEIIRKIPHPPSTKPPEIGRLAGFLWHRKGLQGREDLASFDVVSMNFYDRNNYKQNQYNNEQLSLYMHNNVISIAVTNC